MAQVKDTVAAYPGIAQSVSTYLDDRVRHFDTGSPNDITVRVFGPAFATLRGDGRAASQKMVSGVDGVTAARMDRRLDQPNIEVEVDLDKAKRYGLKPGDVRRAAATMLAGLEVGSLFEQQKVFQVTVWSTPDSRQRPDRDREPRDRHARSGGHVRARRRRRRPHRADADRDPARRGVAPDRHRRST